MNFISRNLGWILLFLFFLFMLFIISTNQKKDNEKTISGSTSSVEVSTGETIALENQDNELDKLVEKITEEEALISQEAMVDEENVDATGALTETKKSIFDIFKRKDPVVEDDTGTGAQEEENIDTSVASQEDSVQDNNGVSPGVQVINNSGQGLTKTTGVSKALVAAPMYFDAPVKKVQSKLPGVHLKTQIGKEFQVGVTALKLNDKTFTQKLAYMSRGDVLKQLTEENKFGCFQIEIVSSSTQSNIGKIGYVCKKYLSELSGNTALVNNSTDNVSVDPIQPEVLSEKKYFRPVSDTVSLTDIASTIVYTTLDSSDILLQISPMQQDGILQVKVVGSNALEKNGIEGYVKFSELSSYTIPN